MVRQKKKKLFGCVYSKFVNWLAKSREQFCSDVIKDPEYENFTAAAAAATRCVCVHARYALRSPNEWILLAYGRFFHQHLILDSMHLSLGISDDLASGVGSSSCLCTTGKKHHYLFKSYLFNPHYLDNLR